MRLNLPLVQYYLEGRRTGYLVQVLGEAGKVVVQPLGAKGTIPQKLTLKIDQVQMVNGQGEPVPEPVTLPASAGESVAQIERERIINMATKKAKKSGSEAKPKTHNVTYFNLTEKAPATKDLKEGSHAFAVASALRNFKGRCERSKLSDYIVEAKLIGKESEMDPKKAINWMVSQFKTKGFIKAEVVAEEL